LDVTVIERFRVIWSAAWPPHSRNLQKQQCLRLLPPSMLNALNPLNHQRHAGVTGGTFTA